MEAQERAWNLSVVDVLGRERRGRVVAARRWREELGRLGEEEFRIVTVEEPVAEEPSLSGPVAVCAPVPMPAAAIGEEGPTWGRQAPHRPQGRARIFAPFPLQMGHRHMVSAEGRPRLEALAQALLLAWDHRRWWEAAAQALAAPKRPASADPAATRQHLEALLAQAQGLLPREGPEELAEALARLQRWLQARGQEQEVKEAARIFPSPTALAADIYAARALAQRPEEALEVAQARRFLAEAASPHHDLELDRALAWEQMSYVVVAVEPQRLSMGRAALESFRARYAKAYEAHHRRYWRTVAELRHRLMQEEAKAQALRRLDALPELGPPVGTAALARYLSLLRYLEPCTAEGPVLTHATSARCPHCHLELGAAPPTQEAEEALAQLDQALGEQMARLARALAATALSQAHDPALERLLKVVQASHLASLAQVLDDRLAAFLRRFLVEAKVKEVLGPLLERLQAGQIPSPREVEEVGQQVLALLRSLAQNRPPS